MCGKMPQCLIDIGRWSPLHAIGDASLTDIGPMQVSLFQPFETPVPFFAI